MKFVSTSKRLFLTDNFIDEKSFSGFITPRVRFLMTIALVSVVVVILENTLKFNANDYISYQVGWFKGINQNLSQAPIFWANTTHLGDATVLLPLLSIVIFKYPQAWAAILGSVPMASFLSVVGKNMYAVPRPGAVVDHNTITIIGDTLTASNSLPSGHTITIFAVVTAILGVIIPQLQGKNKYIYFCLGFLFATIVAISRVAVGAHWPIDVLVGALFGYVSGLSGIMLTHRYKSWWNWITKSKYQTFTGLLLIALMYSSIGKYIEQGFIGKEIIIMSVITGSISTFCLIFFKQQRQI